MAAAESEAASGAAIGAEKISDYICLKRFFFFSYINFGEWPTGSPAYIHTHIHMYVHRFRLPTSTSTTPSNLSSDSRDLICCWFIRSFTQYSLVRSPLMDSSRQRMCALCLPWCWLIYWFAQCPTSAATTAAALLTSLTFSWPPNQLLLPLLPLLRASSQAGRLAGCICSFISNIQFSRTVTFKRSGSF